MSLTVISLVTIVNVFLSIITLVFWNTLKSYQQNRILTFIDPSRDPLGAGYQIIQSKIAIGSGGMYGKGFLAGTQKNLQFVPEHHTDFIFSVIGEEFGFVGSIIYIFVFALFLLRIVHLIFKMQEKEYQLASGGILGYLTFQIFINVGMNLGIMPTTGIALPFISYGGSSLLLNTTAIALILKFHRGRR